MNSTQVNTPSAPKSYAPTQSTQFKYTPIPLRKLNPGNSYSSSYTNPLPTSQTPTNAPQQAMVKQPEVFPSRAINFTQLRVQNPSDLKFE